MPDITQLLDAMAGDDAASADALLPLVYDELRRVASVKMRAEAAGHTLQPTALVHEAYLRLAQGDNRKYADRRHFYRTAAEVMRRILVDRARRKLALKRGGGAERIDWDLVETPAAGDADWTLKVDEALKALAEKSPDRAEVVKLRFFVGLNMAETATALGISEKTVQRHWSFCKAWLYDRIAKMNQE